MSETITCPRCGRSRPAGTATALGDGCPYCLLLLALGDTDAPDSAPDTPTAAMPERVGPYRLKERLGAGGMGSVYRAEHESLGRVVALKILHPEFARRPGFPERFQHEGRILAALQHPHILGVHDVGCDGGFYYLATEYAAGSTLRARMDHGPISVHHAVALCGELCDALEFAHRRGVVHRDIKPENVLLDEAGHVRIADFGIAKLVDAPQPERTPVTEVGAVMGTRRYMAPEQLEPGRAIDHRADLYALGAVLYEMLTGELPLGVFPPPSRKLPMDPRLDAPVLAALAKDPKLRPQSAGEFRQRLQAAVRPLPSYNRRWALGIGVAAIAGAGATHLVRRFAPPPAEPAEPDELAKYGATRLAHPAQVWGVAFSTSPEMVVRPPQTFLLSACEDGNVRWNLLGMRPEVTTTRAAYPRSEFGYLSLALSPNGKTLATAGGENVARLWSVTTGDETATLTGHAREIVALASSPTGRWIATASHDRTVRLWDFVSGAMVHTFGPVEDSTLCVAFSPDGSSLATGLMNGGVRIWDLTTRELLPSPGHAKRVWGLAYDAGGRLITASHDQTLKVWDPATKKILREINAGGEAWSIAISPTSERFAVGYADGTVRLWNMTSDAPLAVVKQHIAAVVSVAFSADGALLADGSLDRSAIVWNMAKLLGPKYSD